MILNCWLLKKMKEFNKYLNKNMYQTYNTNQYYIILQIIQVFL
jgi:hypothetical protein